MGSAWRLAGYRVEQQLGAGAFGEVWRATVKATGSPVALKRIPLRDAAQRDAAVSEAAVLGALDHPNLIRLHRLERTDGAIVLVLDLASAGSLHALLAARGRLTPGEVISALTPIGAALAHAHAAGVVHGDVTPANILFSENGLSLLGDLGVARLIGDRKPVHTTLPYADPLVAAGCLPEPASDIYMLGAVTLHAVTGHPPPSAAGEQDPSAWTARLSARLTRAQVPGPLAAVIVRAMSLEPHLRGSAADFALELRHAGTPVAVELAAGRSRTEPSVSRLAAIAAGRPVGTGQPVGTGRPVAGEPPLTRGARLPNPMPPPARHRAAGRRVLVPVAIVLAAAVVLGCAALWWRAASGPPQAPPVAEPPAAGSSATSPHPGSASRSPAAAARQGDGSPRTASARAPLDVAAALHVLTNLDVTRAQAFLARDPQPLADVYRSPVLLARDRAALLSLVPPGCGLDGVRTRFSDVRIVRADLGSAQLTVSATLAPSTLRCGNSVAGHATGTPTARVAVALVRTSAGWRIAGQHPSPG